MKNLLRAKSERFFNNYAFLFFLFSTAVLGISGAVLIKLLILNIDRLPEIFFDSIRNGGTYDLGLLRFGSISEFRDPSRRVMTAGILSSLGVQSLTAVSISKLITDEFTHRYIYIEISRGYGKTAVLGSCFIISAVYTVIFSLFYLLSFNITAAALGFPEGSGDVPGLGSVLLRQELMLISFSMLCTACALFFRSALRSVLTLFSLIFVLPVCISYVKIILKPAHAPEKLWLLSRLTESARDPDPVYDIISALAVVFLSAVSGHFILKDLQMKE